MRAGLENILKPDAADVVTEVVTLEELCEEVAGVEEAEDLDEGEDVKN